MEGGQTSMVKSVNRRQSLELILMVVMSFALLLNVNSLMNGAGSKQSMFITQAEGAIHTFANAGDSIQQVSEDGLLQTFVTFATGSNSQPRAPSQTVEASNGVGTEASKSGNIGDWITTSGNWALGLLTPSETSSPAKFATGLGHAFSSIPEPMVAAGSDFEHLSRTSLSAQPFDDDVLEQLDNYRTILSSMILFR